MLVAVILVIVLGVVSYINMTPDLLPEIDLPYVVVMTPYIGATPEEVESVITRPVEQSLATLDHIESLSSTSGPNYSLIMLQFSDDANLTMSRWPSVKNSTCSAARGRQRRHTLHPEPMDLLPSPSPPSAVTDTTPSPSPPRRGRAADLSRGRRGVARITATGLISQQVEAKIDRRSTQSTSSCARRSSGSL